MQNKLLFWKINKHLPAQWWDLCWHWQWPKVETYIHATGDCIRPVVTSSVIITIIKIGTYICNGWLQLIFLNAWGHPHPQLTHRRLSGEEVFHNLKHNQVCQHLDSFTLAAQFPQQTFANGSIDDVGWNVGGNGFTLYWVFERTPLRRWLNKCSACGVGRKTLEHGCYCLCIIIAPRPT